MWIVKITFAGQSRIKQSATMSITLGQLTYERARNLKLQWTDFAITYSNSPVASSELIERDTYNVVSSGDVQRKATILCKTTSGRRYRFSLPNPVADIPFNAIPYSSSQSGSAGEVVGIIESYGKT